jgi:branched-subunit amino acid transport protein
MDWSVRVSSFEPSIVLVLCILGTFIWRAFGVAVASRIDISSDLFQWFNCVAYAMLAGLITRVVLIPAGALAGTPDIDRILAILIGFAAFFFFNRNIFYGTGTAFFAFLCATAARHFANL